MGDGENKSCVNRQSRGSPEPFRRYSIIDGENVKSREGGGLGGTREKTRWTKIAERREEENGRTTQWVHIMNETGAQRAMGRRSKGLMFWHNEASL